MDKLKTEDWNKSYLRKENFIIFPKEEVVKFLNRFVRKKYGNDSFKDVLELPNNPKALDLGCGIGRQTILMKEFGFDSFGVDISQVALDQAKEIAKSLGHNLDKNFLLLEEPLLPFENNFFDIAISDSVLDSMEFSFALKYIAELNRTVKSLVYLNLISSEGNQATDVLVEGAHEHGTIQSYYNTSRINELIKDTEFEIIQLNINKIENLLNESTSARFNVVLRKKI
jgi:SAM-dependent methyltransferase